MKSARVPFLEESGWRKKTSSQCMEEDLTKSAFFDPGGVSETVGTSCWRRERVWPRGSPRWPTARLLRSFVSRFNGETEDQEAEKEEVGEEEESVFYVEFQGLPVFQDVKALELFFFQLYRYWRHGGFLPLVAFHAMHLLAVFFTIGLAWLLLLRVNWTFLWNACHEEDCLLRDVLQPVKPESLFGVWMRFQSYLFLGIMGIYLLVSCCIAFLNCREAEVITRFVRGVLHIPSDDAVASLQWPEFLALALQAQKSDPHRRSTGSQCRLTPLDAHQCIMRYDNYLLALVSQQIVSRHLPPWLPQRLLFTVGVSWSFKFALFYTTFNEQRQVVFLRNAPASSFLTLEKRFRIVGVLMLLLLGPALLAASLLAVFKNAEAFRSDMTRPFERVLHGYAGWTIMDYNELPHQYQGRAERCHRALQTYLEILGGPSPSLAYPFLRLAQYSLTALVGLALLLALIDDGPLLHVKVWGRSLIWYSLALGGLLSLVRVALCGMTPAREKLVDGAQAALWTWGKFWQSQRPDSAYWRFPRQHQLSLAAAQVFTLLHTVPSHWRELAGLRRPLAVASMFLTLRHRRLHNELKKRLMTRKGLRLIEDTLGLIVAPIMFLMYLPKAAGDIRLFFQRYSVRSSIGDICAFADFGVRRFEQEDRSFLLQQMRPTGDVEKNVKRQKSALTYLMSVSGVTPGDRHRISAFWGCGIQEVRLLFRVLAFQTQSLQTAHPQLLAALPTELKEPLTCITVEETTFFSCSENGTEENDSAYSSALEFSSATRSPYRLPFITNPDAVFFWFDEMMGLSRLTQSSPATTPSNKAGSSDLHGKVISVPRLL